MLLSMTDSGVFTVLHDLKCHIAFINQFLHNKNIRNTLRPIHTAPTDSDQCQITAHYISDILIPIIHVQSLKTSSDTCQHDSTGVTR